MHFTPLVSMYKSIIMTKLLLKSLIVLTVMLLVPIIGKAEPTLPYQFVNNSPHFADNEIYIGLVGKTLQPGLANVWVDFAANDVGSPQLRSINDSYNTLHKVPGDEGYGNFFFRLSEIKNKTVHLPKIFGCRMYVAFKSPLYIKFKADGASENIAIIRFRIFYRTFSYFVFYQ